MNIDTVMDAVDRFEDSIYANKHSWSEGLYLENIERRLKDAVRYYEKNGDFAHYTDLVEAVTNGTPIYRKHMGYGNGIGFVLIDDIVSIIQDVAEILIKPIIKAKRTVLVRHNKKYDTSKENLVSLLPLNGGGEASISIEKDLASNSDEQFVVLKHPSKMQYTFDSAPRLSVTYKDGISRNLKASFHGYRTIGYKVYNAEGIILISVKSNPSECFNVEWIDTLYGKR